VREDIARAVEYSDGEETEETVFNGLMTSNMQLWLVGNEFDETIIGVLVTKVLNYADKHREVHIVAAGGKEVDKWMQYLDILEAFAHQQGATALRMHGRRGWQKKLKPFGFEERAIVMRKSIDRRH
jgi:hypothetical protein